MNDFKEEYILTRQEYGSLFSYISDERVNSIYFNGKSFWIDEGNERYPAKEVPSREFTDRFISIVCNRCSKRLGATNPVVTVHTPVVSVTLISDTIAPDGPGFLIRKNKPIVRPDADELIRNGLCTKEDIEIMGDIVSSGRSFLIKGGNKTIRYDLMRHLTKYISATDRTVTIEENPELKLGSISSGKDVTELIAAKDNDILSLAETAGCLDAKWVLLPNLRKEDEKVLSYFEENSVSVGAATGGRDEAMCSDVMIEIKEDRKNAVSSYKISKIRY